MTALGWAVYFGYSIKNCEEIIRYSSTVPNADPFLPMKEGFFRGKTARDIAEYYQRKSLVVLLDEFERSADDSLRVQAEETKRLLGMDVNNGGGSRRRRSTIGPRRSSLKNIIKLPGDDQLQITSDTKLANPLSSSSGRRSIYGSTSPIKVGNRKSFYGTITTKGEEETEIEENLDADRHDGTTHENKDSRVVYRKQEQAILRFLELADIPVNEQVPIANLLMKAGFNTVKKISSSSKSSLIELGIKSSLVDLMLDSSDLQGSLTFTAGGEELAKPVSILKQSNVRNSNAPRKLRLEETKDEQYKELDLGLTKVAKEEEESNREYALSSTSSHYLMEEKQDYISDDNFSPPSPQKLDKEFDDGPSMVKPANIPSPSNSFVVASSTTRRMNSPSSKSLPTGKKFHFFASHNWGPHQIIHGQIKLLAKVLERKGFNVWIDEERIEDDILEQIIQGLEDSVIFLACLTNKYVAKVEESTKKLVLDWYAAEFSNALVHPAIGVPNMVPLVMERDLLDKSKWMDGTEISKLKGQVLVDFTGNNVEEVAQKLISVFHQLQNDQKGF